MLRDFSTNSTNVIVTAAQNNSAVHSRAFSELEKYAQRLGAELIVIPIQYNKNAFSAAKEEEFKFASEVIPYFVEGAFKVDSAIVYANCHVLPTAKYPVNAAADLNGGERYTIVASPKMQQKELPRLQGQEPMTCYTTGAVTLTNYLNSRAGSVAEKSHKIGAVHIVDNQVFPLEYDEEKLWVYEYDVAVLGDIHAEQLSESAFHKSIQMIKTHKISTVVLHDLFDCMTLNGHERENPDHLFIHQRSNLEDDLHRVENVLNSLGNIKHVREIVVVRSNHDDMLDRWLKDAKYHPKYDAKNATMYYRLQYLKHMYMQHMGKTPNVLELALSLKKSTIIDKKVNFLELGDSYQKHGVELAHHGHKGVNGARSGLQKTNQKMIVGHSHSGQRLDNFITVGTNSKLVQGYNVGGGSTWTTHNALICKSGRMTLI